MKVLVLGSGGREHAICWKLSQSPLLTKLYSAPGNPGIASIAELVNITVEAVDQLADFAADNKIDLTIVGPELPLTLGVVDVFKKRGLRIFGPDKKCAMLEGSKRFAKEIMRAAGVATAQWQSFTNREDATQYLKTVEPPVVLKADGLAAGKGVFVCKTREEIEGGLRGVFETLSASELVVEQFLEGEEASLMVAISNDQIVPLATSHDYKRLLAGDFGPNTGGMGSVSPTPRLTGAQEKEAIKLVIKPVLDELRRRGMLYGGFLYAGLMLSPDSKIQVLEFNVRLGDPETQAILGRMDSDLLELVDLLLRKEVSDVMWSNDVGLCVVIAGQNYPQSSSYGEVISGLDLAGQLPGVTVFQAGTAVNVDGEIITNGGRVLNVTARGESYSQARLRAYEAIELIRFNGMNYREDIGSAC